MPPKLAESNAAPWRDRVAAEADHADRLACLSPTDQTKPEVDP
jgi:hypothetical protein